MENTGADWADVDVNVNTAKHTKQRAEWVAKYHLQYLHITSHVSPLYEHTPQIEQCAHAAIHDAITCVWEYTTRHDTTRRDRTLVVVGVCNHSDTTAASLQYVCEYIFMYVVPAYDGHTECT